MPGADLGGNLRADLTIVYRARARADRRCNRIAVLICATTYLLIAAGSASRDGRTRGAVFAQQVKIWAVGDGLVEPGDPRSDDRVDVRSPIDDYDLNVRDHGPTVIRELGSRRAAYRNGTHHVGRGLAGARHHRHDMDKTVARLPCLSGRAIAVSSGSLWGLRKHR